MGGRGASPSGNVFAVKHADGSIYHIRPVRKSDIGGTIIRQEGHMRREYGSKTWEYGGRESVKSIKDNYKVYSVKAKAVNPKSYINATQRAKNTRMKMDLKMMRFQRSMGDKTRWDNQNTGRSFNRANRGYVSYSGGKRTLNKSYGREATNNALTIAREERKRALGDMGFSRKFGGGIQASETKTLKKIERKIASLERQLKRY